VRGGRRWLDRGSALVAATPWTIARTSDRNDTMGQKRSDERVVPPVAVPSMVAPNGAQQEVRDGGATDGRARPSGGGYSVQRVST
jgi:hypothetical protein